MLPVLDEENEQDSSQKTSLEFIEKHLAKITKKIQNLRYCTI